MAKKQQKNQITTVAETRNKPDHHCCKNKKEKWILKSRGREKIKMQFAQVC